MCVGLIPGDWLQGTFTNFCEILHLTTAYGGASPQGEASMEILRFRCRYTQDDFLNHQSSCWAKRMRSRNISIREGMETLPYKSISGEQTKNKQISLVAARQHITLRSNISHRRYITNSEGIYITVNDRKGVHLSSPTNLYQESKNTPS